MKKSFYIFFTLIIAVASISISAQGLLQSNGRAPLNGFNKNHTIVNPLNKLESIAYGHEVFEGTLISMPIPEGTPFTIIDYWEAPWFASSMVKGGDGKYYLTDITPQLFEFDPDSGIVNLIGDIEGIPEGELNGISFNPVDNQYYLISSTDFYAFDINTLTATLIGNMGVPGSLFIDLCFSNSGVCYAYDLVTDKAYTIDISTGSAYLLGKLGFDANWGQGMSFDFQTNTIYLSAFNNTTFSGQLRTMNPITGATTLITDWGEQQIAPFAINTDPCSVGLPSNPFPANNTTGLPLIGNVLSWLNGAGTLNVELWFGPQDSITKVYDGPAITSYSLPDLNYFTKYYWYVVCKNNNCGSFGSIWSFKTMWDPNLGLWFDEFENLSKWTVVGPLGMENWSISNTDNAGGLSPELMLNWEPEFSGVSKIRSTPLGLLDNTLTLLRFNYFFHRYDDPSGIVTVGITYDGGTTSEILYQQIHSQGDVGPIQIERAFITPTSGSMNAQLEIKYDGSSYNFWEIYLDDIWFVWIIPVELTSFTATTDYRTVTLHWTTATELNNQGFEIEKQCGSWEKIGFVPGYGTTTEPKSYSFIDKVNSTGTYCYRLKQVDYDGTFKYSDELNVEVTIPIEYSLDQNYPNPFNPTTTISYSLAEDGFVNLVIYNLLGEEVTTLVNSKQKVGRYEVVFDASKISSGIYL
ncbi:MAG TPA: T9SS type A sorting domain-containing protein, partial [Ignavibacteriaceae bacterium]|nr:T9SS type A sorting domain-containing protein [Ignavibacteriaceae bacterium]